MDTTEEGWVSGDEDAGVPGGTGFALPGPYRAGDRADLGPRPQIPPADAPPRPGPLSGVVLVLAWLVVALAAWIIGYGIWVFVTAATYTPPPDSGIYEPYGLFIGPVIAGVGVVVGAVGTVFVVLVVGWRRRRIPTW